MVASDFAFTPTAASAAAGRVTFKASNSGSVDHNLTIEGLKVNQDLKRGTSASVTVTAKPGTYEFHCEYHPTAMKGTSTITG